jgi:hypothetical protein
MNNFSVIILQATERGKGKSRWRRTFDEFSAPSIESVASKGKISFSISMPRFTLTSVY